MTSFAAKYIGPVAVAAAGALAAAPALAEQWVQCDNSYHVHSHKGHQPNRSHRHNGVNGSPSVKHMHTEVRRFTEGGKVYYENGGAVLIPMSEYNRHGGCPSIANDRPFTIR